MNNNDIQQQTPPEEFNIENYPKEKYITGKGEEKERYIVPDDIFENHLKELPDGTINKSNSKRAFHGGALGIFGADPEEDLIKQRAGREAQAAAYRQRRTFKEQIDIILSNIDKENGKTGLENVTVAMYERALAGDTKAAQFLRDTAGEKPADNIDLNANVMTEADKELMQKLKARLN
jgi:hypothetical protein